MNAKKAKYQVIIDCDPGIDDCLALLLALKSPEIEILGITTVSGNVPAALGEKNTLKLLNFAHRLDIPVYCGSKQPLKRDYVSAQDTHGMDGLGESAISEITTVQPQKLDAVSFISQTLATRTNVTIIAIGPLTNLAKSLQQQPIAWQNCCDLISMGGTFKSPGNCSPLAEYNYWCDPDAAEYVFQHAPLPIKMVGLDVTRKIVLTPNILEYIRQKSPTTGEFITAITRFYFDFHWKQEKVIGCVINDPLAVAYLLEPNLCQGFAAYTTVETTGKAIGQTLVDSQSFWHRSPNSFILTQVDAQRFMHIFLQRLIKATDPELTTILQQIM
ncbi:MAG: nucleoside hydrolase [Liquorilactobacillus nagelii]|uniref:Nucleoside hydrolase n=1 Tax=Liquorilactobacillus nagelii TaxID=82688 RepID=A0A3Q8D0U3_9LACO|nr:nucleoside hydrolase [Liquorilactobacillus nagelii]AUJ32598.1 nucleoside hydrolase [Liquorilactobacillus nagelii]MCC7616752.1 nucleoside hydrolase [Liquorilactobacillus nagelii]MCP9315849.1 nucleoside hydrolase [Liquorilactobacillus nagelii]